MINSISRKGSVLVIVLAITAIVPVFFFAVHFFLRNQYRNVNRINNRQILEQSIENHFELLQAKIKEGRFYKKATFPIKKTTPKEVNIEYWIDEFMCNDFRIFVKPDYLNKNLLDHVKIYIKANYQDEVLMGTAKILFSPEPFLDGDSCMATPWWTQDSSIQVTPMIKIVERRIWSQAQINKIEDKLDFKDKASRDILAAYLNEVRQNGLLNKMKYKKKLPHLKFQLSSMPLHMTKQRVTEIFNTSDLDSPSSNTNILLNTWLMDRLHRFRHDLLFENGPLDFKQQKQRSLKIKKVSKPHKLTAVTKKLIKDVFESDPPKNFKPDFQVGKQWFATGTSNALESFFGEINPDTHLQLEPITFITKISRYAAGIQYKIKWQAVCGRGESEGSIEDFIDYQKELKDNVSAYSKDNCTSSPEVKILSSNGPYKRLGEVLWKSPNNEELTLYAVSRLLLKMGTEKYSKPATPKKRKAHPGGIAMIYQ